MVFNSLSFLIFLPIVCILFYLIQYKYRWILIFVASCYFYMAFVPKYILILFFIILVDYFSAIWIERSEGKKRKLFLVASILANLLSLLFFKYFNFANENLSQLLNLFGVNVKPLNLDIILPIGLSFHTFQSMSYTIEVYWKKQVAEKHLGKFANYVLFFPQMVAGPIERYQTLGNELKKDSKPEYRNFSDGFRLILFGLFIKMTIADNIAPYVNDIYQDPLKHNSCNIVLAIILFAFQIYADFYGYSTIALGSAKLLGVNIMDNFMTPFSSFNITEFWRRWHISLSNWFRDYVFTPFVLSHRKWGKWAVMSSIILTFFLSGLWHGAGWNFVIYGLIHGVAILFEMLTSKQRKSVQNKFPKWIYFKISTALTFCYVAFSWIFFRSENFKKVKDIFSGVKNNVGVEFYSRGLVSPIIAVLVLIAFDLFLFNSRIDKKLSETTAPYRWVIYSALLFGLLALSGTQKFNFIYFQF